jgi:hypothetical protein
MSSGRGSEQPENVQEGIRPRYRRAFGCVTWIYMATLVFLFVVSALMAPFWIFGDWGLYSLLEAPSLTATLIFVPAIVAAAILGARTYRSERRVATRNGTYVGLVVGWLIFTPVVWLEVVQAGAGVFAYAFLPLAAASSALIVYALFRGEQGPGKKLVAASALLAFLGGVIVLAYSGDFILMVGAVVNALSGAAAGWTAGIGYARAGGKEMLPPGVVEVPRRKRSERDMRAQRGEDPEKA